MNLTGIGNENEFYSDHYLADIFDGDIRGVLDAWNARETEARAAANQSLLPPGEEPAPEASLIGGGAQRRMRVPCSEQQSTRDYAGYRTPPKRLASIAREQLQSLQAAERIRRADQRVKALRILTCRLLAVFDLPHDAAARVLEDADTVIPLLGELRDADGEPLLWIIEAVAAQGTEPDQDPLTLTIQPEQIETLPDAPVPLPKRVCWCASWSLFSRLSSCSRTWPDGNGTYLSAVIPAQAGIQRLRRAAKG